VAVPGELPQVAGCASGTSVFPEEGVTGWADTTNDAHRSAASQCAYEWLEWSLNPKLQGDLAAGSDRCGRACGLEGHEAAHDEGCATNGFDNFDKILLLEDRQRHLPGRQAGMRAGTTSDDELHRRHGGR